MVRVSDHEVVLTKSLILAQVCPSTRRHIYLWSEANFNHIRRTIKSLHDEFVTTPPPPSIHSRTSFLTYA